MEAPNVVILSAEGKHLTSIVMRKVTSAAVETEQQQDEATWTLVLMLSKAVLQAGGYYFFESKGRPRFDFALTLANVDNKICNMLPELADS